MKHQLPVLFVLVVGFTVRAAAQSPAAMNVVPIGQLDGPIMRQMSAAPCGPFFTIIATDAGGGGIVKLAVQTPQDVQVTSLPVKAIQVKFCDSCGAPQFKKSVDESSVRGELMISRDQWKVSQCLKSAKVAKR